MAGMEIVNLGLSGELLTRAEKEFGETNEIRSTKIEELREKVKELNIRTDPEFLIKFLRSKDFDVEKAFKCVKHYHVVKTKEWPILAKPDCATLLKHVFDMGCHGVLPYRTKDGQAIFAIKLGLWDTSVATVDETYLADWVSLEAAISDPEFQVSGIVVVFDMDGLTFDQVRRVGPGMAKMLLHMVEDALPGRFYNFHIINNNFIFDVLFTIFKPFLSADMKKKIILHGKNLEKYLEMVGVDNLPSDFGGTKPPFDNKEFYKELLTKEKTLFPLELSSVNENKENGL